MRKFYLMLFIFVSTKCLADEKTQVVDIYSLKSIPTLPVLTKGCEGECCGLIKSKKVLADVVFSESPNKTAKTLGLVKKGEVVDQADFFIKILQFGSTKINGKKLTVLKYIAEGNVSVWDGTKVRATECVSGGDKCDDKIKYAKTESWLRIKLKNGLTGWAEVSASDNGILELDTCN
jgi:hypothetical protein